MHRPKLVKSNSVPAGIGQVFTTGAVAKLLGVAPRTVSKWFDRGLLAGYRLPGSRDRRVTREALEQFARQHHIPLRELLIPQSTVHSPSYNVPFPHEVPPCFWKKSPPP